MDFLTPSISSGLRIVRRSPLERDFNFASRSKLGDMVINLSTVVEDVWEPFLKRTIFCEPERDMADDEQDDDAAAPSFISGTSMAGGSAPFSFNPVAFNLTHATCAKMIVGAPREQITGN
uniref:Uncharacterized protein n=1 Tax=Romanomermis culicivorax TaxID=13658 RepID=A0A915JB59_ROMCU